MRLRDVILRDTNANRPAAAAVAIGTLFYDTTNSQMQRNNGTTWDVVEGTAVIADGDKGDITTSGSGATWTIDNDAVNYAKMQNVSAASRLLGRGDSGAGDPQEITLGGGLTMTGTTLSSSGGSGYATVQEEGTPLTARTTLDFVGAGLTASDTGSKTQVAVDATLNALAVYNTNGLLTQTSADTFTGRTLTGTTDEITVTNGDGVSGNPTVSLPATLALAGKAVTVQDNNFTLQDNADTTKKATFECSSISTGTTRVYTLPNNSSVILTAGSVATVQSKTLDNSNTITVYDANFTVQDQGDNTKQCQLQLSGITTGTTRTLTVQDVSGTVLVTGGADVAVADGGTGASTASGARTNLGLDVGMASAFVEAPTNKTFVLIASSRFGFTINSLHNLKTVSGTLTLAVQIGGTNVTGLSSLSVTSTPQSPSASGANTVVSGDRITFVVTSASSPVDLEFTLQYTR